MALVKRVVDAVLDGAEADPETLQASYWAPYELARTRLDKLESPELIAAWERVGDLHQRFLAVANSCVAAALAQDVSDARAQIDELFRISSELTGLLISGSLEELSAEFSAREREIIERYERNFMEAVQIGHFTIRLADRLLLDADDSFLSFLGLSREQVSNLSVLDLFEPGSYEQILVAAVQRGAGVRTTLRVRHQDGSRIPLDIIGRIEVVGGAEILRCLAVNVSQAEAELQQRRLLSTAVEVSDRSVMITDQQQRIVYVNAAFTKLTGYGSDEAIGRDPRLLQGEETSAATRAVVREGLSAGHSVHVEMLNYTKEGLRYWIDLSIVPVRDDAGEVTHFVAIAHDITTQKATEHAIARIALEDHMTALPNRRAAEDRLEREWSRTRRGTGTFAIAIIDIDHFKRVNDLYGHQTGDMALKHVASILSLHMRGADWVARWGGEEFLLCLHDLDGAGALQAGDRLRKEVKASAMPVDGGELSLTISIGIALYDSSYENIAGILAEADSALYDAKNAGRDRVEISLRGKSSLGECSN